MLSAERASPPARRRDQVLELRCELRAELGSPAAHDLLQRLLRERLELVHLRSREQRAVDLEVRVLGRGADQRQEPFLDGRQQRVLLRLVEAVDLVQEENRAPARAAETLACAGEHLADVLDRRGDGGELLELGARGLGDDAGERRLAGARRPVEDRGANPVLGDREPQGGVLAEHVLLPDELVEASRPEPLCERRRCAHALGSRIREEIPHAASMLRAWR